MTSLILKTLNKHSDILTGDLLIVALNLRLDEHIQKIVSSRMNVAADIL